MVGRNSSSTPMAALLMATLMATDGTQQLVKIENEEPKPEPRPMEVEELSRKQRKIYARVMRETENREAALQAALKESEK